VAIGSVPSLIVGVGAGAAASAAFEPALERPKQDAWAAAPNRLPDVGLVAELVAGNKVKLSDGQAMAARLGYDTGPFNSLVWLAQNRLDFPLMLRLVRLFPGHVWQNGLTTENLLDETLAHLGLDWNYHDPLLALKTAERIGIGDIAYAIVRGILPAPSYVPVPPPTTTTNVKRYPQVNVDPEALAAQIGYSPEQLEIMVGRSGLSMAPGMAANAYFRGILADDDYRLAIAEGDLRTEWADPVRDVSRAIPSPDNFVEAHLRGWIDAPTMYAGTALHGMSQPHTDLEYEIHRRPLSPHQIKQALARGAAFNPAAGEIQDPYTASVHQANLGPEWYEMGVALQGSYPSLFITNRLVTSGVITPADGKSWLERSGMADEVVTAMDASWTGTGTAKGDPHVTKAENQLWTTTHKSYVAREITDADANTALTAAGVATAAQPQVLSLWQEERSLIRKQLTPAQVAKAIKTGAINPATGVAWTMADGLAALLARGYDQDDATTLLEESA